MLPPAVKDPPGDELAVTNDDPDRDLGEWKPAGEPMDTAGDSCEGEAPGEDATPDRADWLVSWLNCVRSVDCGGLRTSSGVDTCTSLS